MKTLTRVLIVVAAMLFAACGPESTNPIAPMSQTVAAPELNGTWVVREKSETVFYHIHARGPKAGGWVDVVGVGVPKGDGKLDTGGYELLPVKIGGVRYFSYREKGPKATKAFSFMRYEIDWRGRLTMWMADDNVFADAVRAGKLRGKAKANQFGVDVKLWDTSERIAAFVAAQEPGKAFGGEPLVMEKVR